MAAGFPFISKAIDLERYCKLDKTASASWKRKVLLRLNAQIDLTMPRIVGRLVELVDA